MRGSLTVAVALPWLVAVPAFAGDQPPVFVLKWGSMGSGPGQFIYPSHVAVDGQGNVYVTDTGNDRIQKFDSAGAFLTEWGSFGTTEGKFNSPVSIAVDSDGEVFVGDYSQRIQVFTSDGVPLRHWAVCAGGDTPDGLAVGSDGSVYVVSDQTSRVLKFSNEGAPLTSWGSPGQFIVDPLAARGESASSSRG